MGLDVGKLEEGYSFWFVCPKDGGDCFGGVYDCSVGEGYDG